MDFYANNSLGPWTPNYKPVVDPLDPKPEEIIYRCYKLPFWILFGYTLYR